MSHLCGNRRRQHVRCSGRARPWGSHLRDHGISPCQVGMSAFPASAVRPPILHRSLRVTAQRSTWPWPSFRAALPTGTRATSPRARRIRLTAVPPRGPRPADATGCRWGLGPRPLPGSRPLSSCLTGGTACIPIGLRSECRREKGKRAQCLVESTGFKRNSRRRIRLRYHLTVVPLL